MTPDEIGYYLKEFFGQAVQPLAPGSWQVDNGQFRLLALLSEDQSWLRVLVPIVPAEEAEQLLQQLLEANFDLTQETRYALHQGVLWGVFQHGRESLDPADFTAAVQKLLSMHERGLSESFSQLIDTRLRQIILAAKLQGQSLAATLQNLDRFYQEGLMGEMEQSSEYREQILSAWRQQLERLWPQVEP